MSNSSWAIRIRKPCQTHRSRIIWGVLKTGGIGGQALTSHVLSSNGLLPVEPLARGLSISFFDLGIAGKVRRPPVEDAILQIEERRDGVRLRL
jgi:hypothetical protein